MSPVHVGKIYSLFIESVRLEQTAEIEAGSCSIVSVWCVTWGEMAVSSLAPKANAADASGVGMELMI